MLERDYIEEMIGQFVEVATGALDELKKDHDDASAQKAEDAIASLLDLDPQVALNLSPDSLVTMLVLSGVGDSIAEYVVYSLDRIAEAYDEMGEGDKALMRRAQADAVVDSFGIDRTQVPEGFQTD